MLAQNNGSYASHGNANMQGGRQDIEADLLLAQMMSIQSKIKNHGGAASNEYDDDELDITDSEFENDSELDDDSEQENETVSNMVYQRNVHNMQNTQPAFNMPSNMPNIPIQSVNNNANYDAMNVLRQLSQPSNISVQSANNNTNYDAMNVLRQLSQPTNMPIQSVGDNSNYDAMNAMRQYNAQSNMPVQNAGNNANYDAMNAMRQLTTSTALWQHAQTGQIVNHNNVYANKGSNVGNRQVSAQKGGDKKEDDQSDDDQEVKKVVTNRVVSSRAVPRSCNSIRPRVQHFRRDPDIDLLQYQRRMFDESVTTCESASPSPIKDFTATLKRLKLSRPKFSKLFQRNKTPIESLTTNSTLNTSLSEVSPPSSTPYIPEIEDKCQSPKITTPELLMMPPDRSSIWMYAKDQTSMSYEESIQAFLCFRSIFPAHFLDIRLLKLNIQAVQQIIRQVEHLGNVQEKLVEIVDKESLSGAALMTCDLFELKKSLDLNLGNWTIFEQLVSGLRHIQINHLLNSNMQKQTNVDESITNNQLEIIKKNVFENEPNIQNLNINNEQLSEENTSEETN